LLNAPSPARYVTGRLGNAAQLALAGAPHGSLAAVLDDATTAAADALIAQAGGPAWDEDAFGRLRDHVAGELAEATLRVVCEVAEILDAAADVRRRLQALPPSVPQEAREDVARQLGRLVYPGFVSATGAERLPDVLRYLRAAARRLERLPDNVAVDRDRMRTVHELEAAYRRRREAVPDGHPVPAPLEQVPWLLQELRVSQFAQGLGTRQPISAKRIRRLLDQAA
jgi:ATP-dependent helicase HrpA